MNGDRSCVTDNLPHVAMSEMVPPYGLRMVDCHDLANDLVLDQKLPQQHVVRAVTEDMTDGEELGRRRECRRALVEETSETINSVAAALVNAGEDAFDAERGLMCPQVRSGSPEETDTGMRFQP